MKMIKYIKRTIPVVLFATTLFVTSSLKAQSLRDEILKYTNELRQKKGLAVLEMREDLNNIATRHSTDMAKGSTSFGHNGFDNRRQAAGKLIPGMNAFAENVAYGANTAKEVVTMWNKSSGHRRNMLGNYKYIGIGVASDKNGVMYYTQVFVD